MAPDVYTGTPAQCTAPCIFVLPPEPIGSTTTITLPDFVTSLQLEPGVTVTVTLHPPPIVTDSIQFSNVNVTLGQSTGIFAPTYSIDVPLITTTVSSGTITQVRTLTLPPWPAMTNGPVTSWTQSSKPWGTLDPNNPDNIPDQTPTFPNVPGTTIPSAPDNPGGILPTGVFIITTTWHTVFTFGPGTTTIAPPATLGPVTAPCDRAFTWSGEVMSVLCQGTTQIPFQCRTSEVVTVSAKTTGSFDLGCFGVVQTTNPAGSTPTPWPFGWGMWPVDHDVSDEGEDDDDHNGIVAFTTPCRLWFFFVSWTGPLGVS